jgi:hypothetical protein
MPEITNKDLETYFEKVSENHKSSKDNSGYEINDRSVFKNELLRKLGYELKHILDDVSMKVEGGSKTPDIRLYGENENKTKNSHSQFVIETKNYGLLDKKIDNIDFKQLKNYVISNKSKVRVICSTDYISLYVFNATEIKKQININTLDSISTQEINIFKKHLLFGIHFNALNKRDSSDLKNLSYETVFAEHKFITPTDNEDIYSIQDTNNRNNFITNLFRIMQVIESDVKLDFYDILNDFHKEFEKLDGTNGFKKHLINEVLKENFNVMKSFLIWGSEMNYIVDLITDPNSSITKEEAFIFFDNEEYQEAFILTSVYNLINKTFFIRILEDTSTDSTPFIRGIKNKRYLSNGILQDKINESEEELIQYLKDIYEFSKPDLKQFSFLLRKDIYSWVLEWIDSPNLISFIRLFNDVSFKKLNQDILGDIYEHYLEQDKVDDSKSFRRLLGQYYTPKPVVRLMWFLVRDVLKKTKNRDLFQKDKPLLDILDPAYGSGTFLYEAILHINQSAVGKSITKDGKVWSFIKERDKNSIIENHLYGFEINPLSKSIADVNIFFGLIQAYGNNILNEIPVQHLNIFRTNSLELDVNQDIEEQTASLFPFMADDLKYSLEEKKEILESKNKKYDIIIANPPYGRTTTRRNEDNKNTEFFFIEENNYKFLQSKIIPFAYAENNFNKDGDLIQFKWSDKHTKGKVPDFEKNRGKIQDMYAFFFGIANHLIKEEGVICYIVSNTILGVPSYKWFRKYLLENYKFHYIINFNKIQEDGNSMFAPEAKVATCIIVMQKSKPDDSFEVKYLDLSKIESTIDKFNFISNCKWSDNPSNKNDIISFEVKNLNDLSFMGVPQKKFLEKPDYELVVSSNIIDKIVANTVLLKNCGEYQLGVITSDKDQIFVSSDKKNIKVQVEEFFKPLVPDFKYDEIHVKEYIRHKNINKFNLANTEYIYYNPEYEKIIRDNLSKAFRYRNPDKMSKRYKLLIGSNNFYVDDDFRILDQNCINRRNLYFLVNENENILYYICAILNSKLSKYYRNETQIDNYEVFPIKDYKLIDDKLKTRIIELSKEIHLLYHDFNLFNKNISNYKSDWFLKNISSKSNNISILEGSEFWELSFSNDMVHDLYVSDAKIDEDNKTEIILNTETKIICQSEEIAQKLYAKHLKHYDGDLSEKEITINLTEFNDENKYQVIKDSIENKIKEVEDEIDDLVFKIYEIDNDEREIILHELSAK